MAMHVIMRLRIKAELTLRNYFSDIWMAYLQDNYVVTSIGERHGDEHKNIIMAAAFPIIIILLLRSL